MTTSPQPITAAVEPVATRHHTGGLQRVLASSWGRWLVPSLSDLLFISLFALLFIARTDGWAGLLGDGDIGWHIRVGETVLDTGSVPRQDSFSFTRPQAPWFAWEWLSDALFGGVHRGFGLPGVVLLAALIITIYATILVRRSVWHGANVLIAMGIGLLGVGASSVHYLARPHIFTLILLAVTLWIIEADRRRKTAWIWLLAPISVLWTNLHGGFLALIACLGLLVAGAAIEAAIGKGAWPRVWRYAGVAAVCVAGTVVNPYGIGLHRHIYEYLSSDWIRNSVQEFQPPSFRSENLIQFEILLIAGLVACGLLLRERKIVETLWVLAFAHFALGSTRHVPLFVTVVTPYLTTALTSVWASWARSGSKQSIRGILDQMSTDIAPGFRRSSVWAAVFVVLFVVLGDSSRWPKDFPETRFPARIVASHASVLAEGRVLTDDQWADYLIYRFYPRQRVFIDGRSDFYGPEIGDPYIRVAQGARDWRQILDRYAVSVVLAPAEWPLASLLKLDPQWRIAGEDRKGVLFVKAIAPIRR